MNIFFIQYEKDKKQYNIPRLLGMNVEKIKEPEEIDKKIEEIKGKDVQAIIISSELASFSENILNRYKKDRMINIIIVPSKK